MNRFTQIIIAAAKDSPRIYFLPLMGAINAIKTELQKTNKPQTRTKKI